MVKVIHAIGALILLLCCALTFAATVTTKFNTYEFYKSLMQFVGFTLLMGGITHEYLKYKRKQYGAALPMVQPIRWGFLNPDLDPDAPALARPIRLISSTESSSTLQFSEIPQQPVLTTAETEHEIVENVCPPPFELRLQKRDTEPGKTPEITLTDTISASSSKHVSIFDQHEESNQNLHDCTIDEIDQPRTSRRSVLLFTIDETVKGTTNEESRFDPHYEVVQCDPYIEKCSSEKPKDETLKLRETHSSSVKKHANTMYHKSKSKICELENRPGFSSMTEASDFPETSKAEDVEIDLKSKSEIKFIGTEYVTEIDVPSTSVSIAGIPLSAKCDVSDISNLTHLQVRSESASKLISAPVKATSSSKDLKENENKSALEDLQKDETPSTPVEIESKRTSNVLLEGESPSPPKELQTSVKKGEPKKLLEGETVGASKELKESENASASKGLQKYETASDSKKLQEVQTASASIKMRTESVKIEIREDEITEETKESDENYSIKLSMNVQKEDAIRTSKCDTASSSKDSAKEITKKSKVSKLIQSSKKKKSQRTPEPAV